MNTRKFSYDDLKAASMELSKQLQERFGSVNMGSALVVGEPISGNPLAVEMVNRLGCHLAIRQIGMDQVFTQGGLKPPVIIWVDSVVDSGKTKWEAIQHLQRLIVEMDHPCDLITASWVYRSSKYIEVHNPDFICLEEIMEHEWAVFPWEVPAKAQDAQALHDMDRDRTKRKKMMGRKEQC